MIVGKIIEQTCVAEEQQLARWCYAHFGPWPGMREVQVACVPVVLACFLLTGLSLGFGFRGLPVFGHYLGGDFLAWYIAGTILNEHSPEQLYDIPLEHRLQRDIRPALGEDLTLVYANAPWLAMMFRPVARLPYIWAYILWLSVSGVLYIGGLSIIWPRGEPFNGLFPTVLLVAVSFFPFAFECWFGGQLSIIAFFSLALCIRSLRTGHCFGSGAALALCTYKPSLLLMLLPMLIVGRRYRMLAGFAAGSSILACVSFLGVGYLGFVGYSHALEFYTRTVASAGSSQNLLKYVDMNTLVRLLFGRASLLTNSILVVAAGFAIISVGRAWRLTNPMDRESESLLWATAIASTLVVNVYVPIYDCILIVLTAVLMARVLYGRPESARAAAVRRFHVSLLALWLIAFVTQYLAAFLHIQLITFCLAALGVQAFQLWRACSLHSAAGTVLTNDLV
jgi:hypothetical protein